MNQIGHLIDIAGVHRSPTLFSSLPDTHTHIHTHSSGNNSFCKYNQNRIRNRNRIWLVFYSPPLFIPPLPPAKRTECRTKKKSQHSRTEPFVKKFIKYTTKSARYEKCVCVCPNLDELDWQIECWLLSIQIRLNEWQIKCSALSFHLCRF